MDFLEREVLPALFVRLDTAFPDFGWKRKGAGWQATANEWTHSALGVRADRVVCNRPFGFYVHGGEATSWTAHVNGGSTPSGRDFVEAVRELARRAGVDASPLDREPSPEEAARARARDLLDVFADYAHRNLGDPAGLAARKGWLIQHGWSEEEIEAADFGPWADAAHVNAARGFLQARGFEPDALEGLPLGFFGSQEGTRKALLRAGFSEQEVRDSGLLADGRWENRLVIPWRDPWGRVATVAARDVTGTAEEGAKYLYLRGGRKPVAFGLDVALRSKEGKERLVLVEGLLDVVLLQARGLEAVAALGGAGDLLTPARWETLAGFGVRSVVLALDADEAGREGAAKALSNASKASKAPNVYVYDPTDLRGCKDPDELVRRDGLDAFVSALETAKPGPLSRGLALLEGVTPESPDHVRREASERVLELVETLRGDRAGLDREDLLRLAAERTAYTFETLQEVAEDHAARRRREERERSVDAALRQAVDARRNGDRPEDVAELLRRELVSVEAAAEEPPAAFSVERLERESAHAPAGRPSGWDALDACEVAFHAGELALLAARTGHGKTSALVGLLGNWLETAKEEEVFVLYSAEEPEVRIFHRLLSLVTAKASSQDGSRWTANEVRDYLRDKGSRETWPKPAALGEAREKLRSWESRLLVVNRPRWTVAELEAHARELAERRPVGAVLVDYLQRIPPPPGSFDRRDLEVSAVGRRLKALAVDVGSPVVLGAQINREAIPPDYGKKLTGKTYQEAAAEIRKARPDLHHLREGGSEQEADLVLGLLNYAADYRTEAKAEGDNRPPAVTLFEVGVLKNRYGSVGRWAGLAFEGRFTLLRDPSVREEEDLAVETPRGRSARAGGASS